MKIDETESIEVIAVLTAIAALAIGAWWAYRYDRPVFDAAFLAARIVMWPWTWTIR